MTNKKILFISYLFPPVGGGGVLRTAKFVKYLPYFGWKPFVLTPKKAFYPIEDRDLVKDIPDKVEIKRINYIEPAYLIKNRYWQSFLNYLIYPLFLIPDRQVLWALPAIIVGYKLIKKENIKYVYSSFSPASDHLIALVLKKLTGAVWIADFRDEWTKSTYFHFPSFIHKKIAQYFENKIVSNADKVITISEGLTKSYDLHSSSNKFYTITNGFDWAVSNYNQSKSHKCKLLHVGSLYGLRKADALTKVVKDLSLKDLELEFIGEDKKLSHSRAIQKMFTADILLLVLAKVDGPGVLSGKLFEYLGARKPILALAPKKSGAASLIKELKVGEIASPDNVSEIKKALLKLYRAWQKNNLKIPAIDLKKYHRKELTRQLVEVLEKNNPAKKKIKLCLIGNACSPQNQNLCHHLVKAGYDLHFISTNKAEIEGVKIYCLPKLKFTPWYVLRSLMRIKKLIKIIKPDIVHGQDLVFGGIWAYLSKFKPFIVTTWGSDVMNYKKFIFPEKYLIRKTLLNANMVTVSSKALLEAASQIGMNYQKAKTIHFGVDLSFFTKRNVTKLRKIYASNQEKIIYCPRSVAPIYNTDILIQAFAKIATEYKVKLLLTRQNADKNYLTRIEGLIIKHNLIDKVVFLPKLPFKKIPDFYNLADIVVSLTSSDGCSVSFLEAMACQKKIVLTDLPYIQEWKKEGHFWTVPVRDINKTAESLGEALKYPELKWQKKGLANRELIKKNAEIEDNFNKLNTLYRGLI